MDKIWVFTPDYATTPLTIDQHQYRSFHKDFSPPLRIEYSGITGAIGEIASNNILLLTIADTTHAVNGLTITGHSRIRFID